MNRLLALFAALALFVLSGPAHAYGGGHWTSWARDRRKLPPVAGLVLQFESDIGVALSGSSVTSWTDNKSKFVASQGTGSKQPSYTAADANFGGRPSLTWSRAAVTELVNTTDTPVAQSATRTYFMVVRPTDTQGGSVLDRRGAAQRAIFQWLFSTNTFIYTDAVAINQVLNTNPTFQNTKYYLSEIWASGSTMQAWLNGVSQTVNGGTLQAEAAVTAGFTIGGRANSSDTFDGQIPALFMYTGALSAGNRQLVEMFIAQKYGF